MTLQNTEIADRFEELADLLEIEGANPFRVRAYRNAAQLVRGQTRAMADRIEAGEDLTELPGIGDDLADKIAEMVAKGDLELLQEVRGRTPPALVEIMHLKGLGPKRVKALHEALDVDSLEDLRQAAEAGRIRELEGFGEKTEASILRHIEQRQGEEKRTGLARAEALAAPLVETLGAVEGVEQVEIAGSYRRCKETVGDIDILVRAAADSPVMQAFVGFEAVAEVVSQGDTRSTVILRSGLQVDLRRVDTAAFGAALVYFTGSRAHNIAIRRIANGKGYKINEYGVFEDDERIAGETEAGVYGTIDLAWIPPELRENRGEVDAAREGRLPELVTLDDIRGDLHCHTDATDGRHGLAEMAEAAAGRGYDYLAITDHSRRVSMANGLDPERLARQIDAIDALNDELDGITLLKGIEVDILEDGSLDLPDAILERLDLRVCAVHYGQDRSREQQTTRILKAMDNPLFNILAHPTGRLLNKRGPYPLDLQAVLEGAAERGCFVELNANPNRLDLDDDGCMQARELGLKVPVSTDAHQAGHLDFMRFGINQARRGWLEAADVLNTLSLKDLVSALAR